MNSDTKFPGTIPPFRFPVPPPDAEPDDDPLVQVCVNFDWMAYILGALKSLMLQATWKTDDDDDLQLALQRTELLIGMFMQASDGCNGGVPSILCIGGSFADLSYGFVPAIAAPCSPVYVNGVGFQSCHDTGDDNEQIRLIRPFTGSTFIRHVKFRFTSTTPTVPYTASVDFFLEGVSVFHFDDFLPLGGGYLLDQDVDQQADLVLVQQLGETGGTGVLTLEEFELCYSGDFPLSEAPAVWTHVFDFTIDDGGGVFSPHAGRALYATGVGWQANPGASVSDPTSLIQFDSSSFPSTVFTSVKFELDAVLGGRHLWQWFPNGTEDLTDSSAGVSTVTITHTDTMTNFFIGVDSVAVAAPTLTKITFSGIGNDPF